MNFFSFSFIFAFCNITELLKWLNIFTSYGKFFINQLLIKKCNDFKVGSVHLTFTLTLLKTVPRHMWQIFFSIFNSDYSKISRLPLTHGLKNCNPWKDSLIFNNWNDLEQQSWLQQDKAMDFLVVTFDKYLLFNCLILHEILYYGFMFFKFSEFYISNFFVCVYLPITLLRCQSKN